MGLAKRSPKQRIDVNVPPETAKRRFMHARSYKHPRATSNRL